MLTQSDLDQFYGTENHYKHLFGLIFTDGIKYLAEKGKAYWLLDIVASYQSQLKRNERTRYFQIWILKKNDDNSAVVTCQEDSGIKPVITQKIPYTDFPLDEIKLYVENGVLLLPSEH